MKRFTEKFKDERNILRKGIMDIFYVGFGRFFTGKAIDKLAEYENLEEQGKLLRLPCANERKGKETQNLITICAVQQDGMDTRHLIITLRLLDGPINIMDSVTKACNEYIKTPEGKERYKNNSECFNWADFEAHVPNEICRNYGFEKSDSILCEVEVDWDEQLVDDFQN